MHKNEPRANPTFINRVIIGYELKTETTRTHKRIDSLIIQFWSWFNIPPKKINYTLVPFINNNETKFGPIPTIHYMQIPHELVSII